MDFGNDDRKSLEEHRSDDFLIGARAEPSPRPGERSLDHRAYRFSPGHRAYRSLHCLNLWNLEREGLYGLKEEESEGFWVSEISRGFFSRLESLGVDG